jgi:zeaxanthin glucosyltransferase
VARFLVVVLPTVSHLHAPVAIGQALVDSGHEVAWCGPERDLRPLVGPDAVIYRTGKRYYRQLAELGMGSVRALWDGFVTPANRFMMRAADRAVADYRPDVVLVDQYALAGALAAYRRGVRWATLCIGVLELTPPTQELPELPAWVRAQLARIWAMTDLPVDDTIDLRFSPYLVIGLTTSALTGPVALPPQCVLVGPALGRRPPERDFPWAAWDPDGRHVLVTVGTFSEHISHDFYARMQAALALLGDRVQAVFLASAAAVPRPPPQVLVVPRVAMLDLLPRLDAVVCHGGLNTVTEALAHGVPLVVAGLRLDQPLIARQVAGAGAGVAVSFRSATPAQLAAALRAVLDEPRYRARARRVGESFAAAGGAAAAAAHLVALARSGAWT